MKTQGISSGSQSVPTPEPPKPEEKKEPEK
jgi:hypothetical protein